MSCEYENIDLNQGILFEFSDGTKEFVKVGYLDLDDSYDYDMTTEFSLVDFISLMTDKDFRKTMESLSKDDFLEKMKEVIKKKE